MPKYCKTIRSEGYSLLIVLQYLDITYYQESIIWTLGTTLIQLVSILFIAALYTVPTLF